MKILAIRYSGLGDIVMLLPTLHKLKLKYKNAHITLLTDVSNKDLQSMSCNLIDKIITINRNYFRNKEVINSLKELISVLKQIRQSFDICIDFQNFGETATISYLSNSKIKLGSPKKEKYYYGYTNIISRNEKGHRSQFFSRIAHVNDILIYPKLCMQNESILFSNTIKLNNKKKTIGLNIGSTQENRRWSEKNFSILADDLKSDYNILIFIGPNEIKYEKTFNKNLTIIKDVNLIKLAGAISICDIFITNDTGPAHMAAALNVSTLTLFSTGDDTNVGALILNKEYLQNKNINEITVEAVKNKIIQLD